jgi:Flp pilus assembly protein CpaB
VRKLNTTILIGLLVAALGFVLVFAYGRNVDDRVADGKATQEVLVATERLTAGTTPADLEGKVERRAVPTEYLADDVIKDLDEVAGLVLLGPVPADGQLSKSLFGQARDAAAVRPSKGNVALAVGVDLTPGVARYITAGSTVDVFATYTTGSSTTNGANGGAQRDVAVKRTKLFASNIKVLSVSVAEVPDDDAEDEGDVTSAQDATVEVVAVLDLSPAEAEQVVNAQTLGEIYLALNSVDGKGEEHKTPSGVTPETVVTANK